MSASRETGLGILGNGVTLVLLLVLTAVTCVVALVDLGPFNTPVAFTIAVAKAGLVAAVFMRLRVAPGLVRCTAFGAVFWFGILVVLTLSDVLTRNSLPPVPGK